MVRVKKTTWVTPTTYGSVFTSISETKELKRVFLDNEATDLLCSNQVQFILDKLRLKGIVIDDFMSIQQQFIHEKTQCHQLSDEKNWELFSLFPLQFSMQIINYCNARCDFCYANAQQAIKKKKMDLEFVRTQKDYAAEHGCKCGISGGEPLLHPQIYEILSYRQDEVFDTLITNLTAPFDLNKLIETNVDLIQVSVHGYDTNHDKIIRIPGAYRLIMDRIQRLISHIPMATNTVITPQNIKSIPDLIDDLHKIQNKYDQPFSYIRFVPVVPSGAGLNSYKEDNAFFDETERLLIDLEKTYTDMNFEIPLIHANPYEYKRINDRWLCPAGSTVAVVRLDGHLIPCNQFLDTAIASKEDLFHRSFQNIWMSDALFSHLRKGIQATKKRTCAECMYLIMKQRDQIIYD